LVGLQSRRYRTAMPYQEDRRGHKFRYITAQIQVEIAAANATILSTSR
jgi:hypothetical protein